MRSFRSLLSNVRPFQSATVRRTVMFGASSFALSASLYLAQDNNVASSSSSPQRDLKKIAEELSRPVQEQQHVVVVEDLNHQSGRMLLFRTVARFIDLGITLFIAGVTALVGGLATSIAFSITFDLLKDVFTGRSPGKWLLGLWPVDANTRESPSKQQLLVRNLLAQSAVSSISSLLVPFGPLGLVGVLLLCSASIVNAWYALFNVDNQTITDVVAGTIVVKGHMPYERREESLASKKN